VAQSPEEELSAFLKDLPTYMQKALWYESMSALETAEYIFGLGGRPLTESDLKFFENMGWQPDKRLLNEEDLRKRFVQILQRCNPAEWDRYRKNAKLARTQCADLTIPMPRRNPGRPRKGDIANEASQLRAEKELSYAKIAMRLNQKHGDGTATRESVRKLLSRSTPRTKSQR
jgi:hypothetical protein